MEQAKIVPLIILYVVGLDQVKIGGKGMKLYANTTAHGRNRQSPSLQSWARRGNDARSTYRILESFLESERKLTLSEVERTYADIIKDVRRAPDVTLPPQIDHFKNNHQRTNSELIWREKGNFPAFQRGLGTPVDLPRSEKAISRSYATVRTDTLPLTADMREHELTRPKKRSNNVQKPHVTEIKSVKPGHSIVKRSQHSHNGGKLDRPTKRQLPRYRVHDSVQQVATCPGLPVTTRTIINCTKGRLLGSKCYLRCAPGYVMSSKRRIRKCKIGKRGDRKNSRRGQVPSWTGKQENYQCVPICEPLDRLHHGTYDCDIMDFGNGKAYGCTARCKSGFKIDGTEKRVCMENGEWSGHTATCKPTATRHTRKVRFKYEEHQTFPCGQVYSMANFNNDGSVYLVVAENNGNVVKIYRWDEDGFIATPCQTFHFLAPSTVEILTARDGTMWLMVAGGEPSTFYRFHSNGRFQRSHTSTAIPPPALGDEDEPDAVGFAKLRGQIYRCYGRNRRDATVMVVHRLQEEGTTAAHSRSFKRVMRKKFPGEKVNQCSMYTEGSWLYTVATVNKPGGSGRIIIGYLRKNKMKVVDIVSGRDLQNVSDSVGFTVRGERFIAVSQATENGRCMIYKRIWRTHSPVETG